MEPEMEKFEITDEDLAQEMHPRAHRRQSKNQAIYGIWAEHESDDDDGRPGFGQPKKKKADYTAPMGFVSGGFKEGDKVVKPGEVSDDSGGEDFDIRSMTRILDAKKPKQSKPTSGGGRFAQSRQDGEFGKWEKHTKGIGQKLLLQMGYEPGKGLGKTAQGITTPVEAVKRSGRGAIGRYGTERSERSLKDFPVKDLDEEEEKEFKEQLHQWKKQPEGLKKKPKYTYKTAQEVIATGKMKKVSRAVPSAAAKVKVIDMTGREKRILSGYHAISHRHDFPDDEEEETTQVSKDKRAFDMPELIHNLNLLVNLAEEDIIVNDRKLHHERDLVINLRHEKERMDAVCEQEAKQLETLNKIMEVVENCEVRTQLGCDNPLTLDECASIFRRLQDDFYMEYKMYDLASLAIALVFPMMKQYLSGWDPLKDASYGKDTVMMWKCLLEDGSQQYGTDMATMDVYQRLIWEVWLPLVRTCVLKWNVRNCDPLIEMLETWMPLLPHWIMENIQNQLVLPRLLQEVSDWNPLTDAMPIHSWLHPWLPLMGDKLDPLYAPIRHKFANALTNWHPSDNSAKVILQPWVRVFKPGHMEAFVVKHIMSKLAMCMQEFVINPNQQIIEPWHWVMSWSDIIPVHHMVAMLEKTFFPKWLSVLCSWLGNMPNYEEVTKWYLGWKSLFSEQYLSHPVVKEKFTKALEIMSMSISGNFQPGARENIAYFTHQERRQMADSASLAPQPPPSERREYEGPASIKSALSNQVGSFKELVEKKAMENGVLFMPIPGKTQEARQVYKFGKTVLYLDRSVIFAFENQQWIPISLQRLIDISIG